VDDGEINEMWLAKNMPILISIIQSAADKLDSGSDIINCVQCIICYINLTQLLFLLFLHLLIIGDSILQNKQ